MVSDVTGKTGMLIIRAIIAGERDPVVLAQHRQRNCRKDEATIAASLEGHYRAEHLFALQQAVEFYDFYQQQIAACNLQIAAQLQQMSGKADPSELPDLPKARSKHPLLFDVRSELYRLTGVDLTRIDGMNEGSVLKVLAETGTDMSHWPTEKHFASWLGLCPGNKVTGGKILNSKTKPCANRAAATFRLCAFSLFSSNSALGAYFRRQRARLGAPKAITATAHKLARIFYSMLKNGQEYVDQGRDEYEKQYQERVLSNLKKKAASLGYQLMPDANKEGAMEGLKV